MRKSDLKWNDSLSALYGTSIDALQGEVWQVYLRELNTTNAEITEAIEMAVKCDLKPKEWRVTVTDLIRWVEALRKKNKAEATDPRKVTKEQTVSRFKAQATERMRSGEEKKHLIDDAWWLPGLSDDEVGEIIEWIRDKK